jgi:hypothetical protein
MQPTNNFFDTLIRNETNDSTYEPHVFIGRQVRKQNVMLHLRNAVNKRKRKANIKHAYLRTNTELRTKPREILANTFVLFFLKKKEREKHECKNSGDGQTSA